MFSKAFTLALLSTVLAAPAVLEVAPFGLVSTMSSNEQLDGYLVFSKDDGSLWLRNPVNTKCIQMIGNMDLDGRVHSFNGTSISMGEDSAFKLVPETKTGLVITEESVLAAEADNAAVMVACPVDDGFKLFTSSNCEGRVDLVLRAITNGSAPLSDESEDHISWNKHSSNCGCGCNGGGDIITGTHRDPTSTTFYHNSTVTITSPCTHEVTSTHHVTTTHETTLSEPTSTSSRHRCTHHSKPTTTSSSSCHCTHHETTSHHPEPETTEHHCTHHSKHTTTSHHFEPETTSHHCTHHPEPTTSEHHSEHETSEHHSTHHKTTVIDVTSTRVLTETVTSTHDVTSAHTTSAHTSDHHTTEHHTSFAPHPTHHEWNNDNQCQHNSNKQSCGACKFNPKKFLEGLCNVRPKHGCKKCGSTNNCECQPDHQPVRQPAHHAPIAAPHYAPIGHAPQPYQHAGTANCNNCNQSGKGPCPLHMLKNLCPGKLLCGGCRNCR